MRSFEALDALLTAAATGTRGRFDRRGRVSVALRILLAFMVSLRRIQLPAAQRQFVGAMAVGEKSVMANPIEAVRQDVEEEAANELTGSELHRVVIHSLLRAIILPAEDDVVAGLFDEPALAEGDAMGVAREKGQDLF